MSRSEKFLVEALGEGTGGKGRGREKGSRREGIAVEKNPYFKACNILQYIQYIGAYNQSHT